MACNFSALALMFLWISRYPIQLCINRNNVYSYLNSTVDRAHHGLVIYTFSVLLLQFFVISRRCQSNELFYYYWWYSLAMQQTVIHKGAFVIIFLIRNELLNCLRGVVTIVAATESGWHSSKFIFTKKFFTERVKAA